MKIAIFGDSFASDSQCDLIQSETSWIDVLNQSGYNILDNYALGGSSLYYSYSKYLDFKKKHSDFDKIIFFLTRPHRYELKVTTHDEDLGTIQHTITVASHQLPYIDSEIASESNIDKRRVLQSYRNFVADCYDFNREELFNKLLLKEIINDSKILYVDSFGVLSNTQTTLVQLQKYEAKLVCDEFDENDELKFWQTYKDMRKCHFTSINNITIANKIIAALNNNERTIALSKNDIQKPEHPWTHYFKPYE